jgi:hypothetical protein
MDIKNPYETPVTFKLHRAEYLIAFAITIVLMLIHFTDINWFAAIGLFLYIDLIGYIPGAIAYRRSEDGRIPKFYYVLYNTMHSFITCGLVVGLWMLFVGPEWALLAVAFHVFGDRGVFGNFLKPFGLPFEPEDSPQYQKLVDAVLRRGNAARVPAPADAADSVDVTAPARAGL